MAQILLHLPLRANIAEQLYNSGASRERRASRGSKVSSLAWLNEVGRCGRGEEKCSWWQAEEGRWQRGPDEPTTRTAPGSGLSGGGATENEHGRSEAPNMRLCMVMFFVSCPERSWNPGQERDLRGITVGLCGLAACTLLDSKVYNIEMVELRRIKRVSIE